MQNAMVNFKELEYLENTGTSKTFFKEGKSQKIQTSKTYKP